MKRVVLIILLVVLLAVMAGSAVSAGTMDKVYICHQDVDDDDPEVDQVPIWVNGNSVEKHLENHGDFVIEDAEECPPLVADE